MGPPGSAVEASGNQDFFNSFQLLISLGNFHSGFWEDWRFVEDGKFCRLFGYVLRGSSLPIFKEFKDCDSQDYSSILYDAFLMTRKLLCHFSEVCFTFTKFF